MQLNLIMVDFFLFNDLDCNHGEGTSDEINLIGVPLGKTPESHEQYDTISSAMERNHSDIGNFNTNSIIIISSIFIA